MVVDGLDDAARMKVPRSPMLSLEDRRAFAQRHVEFGRLLIIWQREMVGRHKAEGRDPTPAQNLLAVLERTQQVLERDLTRLTQQRTSIEGNFQNASTERTSQ